MPLEGPPDVEIVGAGITGCSAAHTLAEAGLRVRVHEARKVAEGASGRNGGFALRGGAMPYDRAREWLGADRARDYWALTERYLRSLADLVGDALRPVGSLRLAADTEERDELRFEYDALREDGFEAEWREPVEPPLDRRFPAAIFHPTDAAVQPARMTRRLAERAAASGVEFVQHHRVKSLEELDADRVLVATDGYPSGLLGEFEGLIVPTRGQMIATAPISEKLFACPHYGRHGFDYWQQLEDGRLTAGGFRDTDLTSEFTADEWVTPTIQEALEEFLAGLLGRPVEVTHRWAGIFGLVLDFLPVVGPAAGHERVWICGGYSGHGNVLAFMCGDLVARAMLGDTQPELSLFDPARLLATA
ncbi:MAG: FAD-dependent oxidoreductase [Actinobacteria bacterium]|nr:FAD-dependent oxidoreductase [Actinomycetota bacterium]